MSTRNKLRLPPPGAERLTRVKDSGDKFYVDPSIIPDGMSYEWKRVTYVGKEDRTHQARMARNHWRPVPSSRHPEIAGGNGDEPIVIEGLMLMEREAYLTDEAHAENKQAAFDQVQTQMARLQQIEVGRGMEAGKPSVVRSMERVAIPADESEEEDA